MAESAGRKDGAGYNRNERNGSVPWKIKKEELEKEQKIWYSRNENNRIVREHLKKVCEKLEKLQEDYTCLGTLDQTANGNLSGAVKIDFESYVQRQYFDRSLDLQIRD